MTTTFLKVGRSGISVGRYSDCYPNEVRSNKQYGILYDGTRDQLFFLFIFHSWARASGNTLVYNTSFARLCLDVANASLSGIRGLEFSSSKSILSVYDQDEKTIRDIDR